MYFVSMSGLGIEACLYVLLAYGDFNLNNRLFQISHSIMAQTAIYYLHWKQWIDLSLSNIEIYWKFISKKQTQLNGNCMEMSYKIWSQRRTNSALKFSGQCKFIALFLETRFIADTPSHKRSCTACTPEISNNYSKR